MDDLFYLGVPDVGGGNTKVYVATVGNTWTISPTMVFDGNIGMNKQNQTAAGGDFGTNFGSETFGLPGTNGPNPLQSGMPYFDPGMSTLGNNAGWTPLERHETSYTATANLTKLYGAHEIRTGFDFIRYQLNHWQPELGSGPRGNFSFSGNLTGASGYTPNLWNQYAGFLMGLDTGYGKSIQYQIMSGRENQYGTFISDRWNVSQKLTLNLGLRYEYYPLMSREDRGIEVLDIPTFNVLLGGVGNVPKNNGIKVSKTLFAPRLGAAYRINEKTVFRAGYGQTFDPIPWSRPLRGFYPLTIGYANSVPNNFDTFALASGIPEIPLPDLSTGVVKLPPNTLMRFPDPNNVDRGRTQQYNVTVERQLPSDITVSAAYVGTRMDGGYSDLNLNYSEPGGGETGRMLFAQAGTADINQWASFTKRRYNALQVAVNRPFKAGLLLKGAYTLSKAMNETDDDGWVGLSWNQPSQLSRNYALAGYDRTHNFQMGFLYDLPFAKGSSQRGGDDRPRLAAERRLLVLLRHAVHDRRQQHRAQPARRHADHRPGRATAARRGSRSERGLLQPGVVRAAGQQVGQHGTQPVPRAQRVQPRHGSVPRLPGRTLSPGVPCDGQQRAEPFALGQPGDGHHEPELHEDPYRYGSAEDSARTPLRVLITFRSSSSAGRHPPPGLFLYSDSPHFFLYSSSPDSDRYSPSVQLLQSSVMGNPIRRLSSLDSRTRSYTFLLPAPATRRMVRRAVVSLGREDPRERGPSCEVRPQLWRPGGLCVALLALLTTGVIAAPLHAQILYGSIVGVVQDAQGSSIPAATVTVVNKDTNLTQETVSNENGEYTITNLQPGTLRRQGRAARLP